MLFSELKGLDGIDKLNECVEYVDEIMSDTELFKEIGEKKLNWMQAASPIYKKHTNSITKIMEILGEKPDTAIGIMIATSNIIGNIFTDKETAAFFYTSSENLRSMLSATGAIKDKPSKGS